MVGLGLKTKKQTRLRGTAERWCGSLHSSRCVWGWCTEWEEKRTQVKTLRSTRNWGIQRKRSLWRRLKNTRKPKAKQKKGKLGKLRKEKVSRSEKLQHQLQQGKHKLGPEKHPAHSKVSSGSGLEQSWGSGWKLKIAEDWGMNGGEALGAWYSTHLPSGLTLNGGRRGRRLSCPL